MELDFEKKNVYCRCCGKWHSIAKDTLWIPRDENADTCTIYCLRWYPDREIILGYSHDLE